LVGLNKFLKTFNKKKTNTIFMQVKQAMTKQVLVTSPDFSVRSAAKIMAEQRVGSLVVQQDDKIVGIITELDIIWKVVANDKDPNTTTVEEVMTKKVITIRADQTLEEASALMVEHKIKKLPVLEKDKLVGIITATDLISVQPKMIEILANLLLFEEKKSVAG
jgi:CBS domain-containing protein